MARGFSSSKGSPVAIFLVGLVFVISGSIRFVSALNDSGHFAHPTTTNGTVIGSEWRTQSIGKHHTARMESPKIRFTDSSGASHTFYGQGTRGVHPEVGETKPVQYDPKDPSYARLGTGYNGLSGWKRWGSWLPIPCGLLIMATSGYVMLRVRRGPIGTWMPIPRRSASGPYQAGSGTPPQYQNPQAAPAPQHSAPPSMAPMSMPAPQQAPATPTPVRQEQPQQAPPVQSQPEPHRPSAPSEVPAQEGPWQAGPPTGPSDKPARSSFRLPGKH